jgi:superfamily II DNA or RNA helicase
MPEDIASQIENLKARLTELDRERSDITKRLTSLESASLTANSDRKPSGVPGLDKTSPSSEKLALFASLFRGREDVYARRWENAKTGKSGYAPACRNEWVRGVCGKPRVKCGECTNQAFLPLTEEVLTYHLTGREPGRPGDFTLGVYPLLADDTCWFIALDFDKKSWRQDVTAFREVGEASGVRPAIERSRSGEGAHAWIFFSEPVPAYEARRLAASLITAAMDRSPEIGFDSYDRLFPSQDTTPAGGFGNLIALPLQGRAREHGNTVFLDGELQPYEDQWPYLSCVDKLSRQQVLAIVNDASSTGQILGLRLPSEDEDDEPWASPPSRRKKQQPIQGDLPEEVDVVLGNRLYVDRSNLPPTLTNRLARLAAFQNPEFYAAQAMRLPTFGKPRVISCAELFPNHLALPRGCLDELQTCLRDLGIRVTVRDERQMGTLLSARFLGELTTDQEKAASALFQHETGVLAAATAFGKTVVAAKLIAARGRNTLILVHRRQLLEQWVARLQAFLDIDPKEIGAFHGGRKEPTGKIDVALMQSLVRKGVVSDLVGDYGHLVIDECHHLSAVGFEAVAREAKAKYVLGLSATVTRKDGHHPIIFMQCGPLRHRVSARKQAERRPFEHRVIVRNTQFRARPIAPERRQTIQNLYAELAQDQKRNDLIFDDIIASLEAGRSPLVITERKDHLEHLATRLSAFVKNLVVLKGGMKPREARAAAERLAAIQDHDERVLLATGRFLGEGFDDARLDTLFLTMPISWRGTLAQYAGRLHRRHAAKRYVLIYDYVDENEPMLARMALKRDAGYRSLGYRFVDHSGAENRKNVVQVSMFDATSDMKSSG